MDPNPLGFRYPLPATMGERVQAYLKSLQNEVPYLGEVRGRGLMVGVEVTEYPRTEQSQAPAPNGQLAAAIQQQCLRLGLILETGGREGCTLRFLPPLIITQQEIDKVAELFRQGGLNAVVEWERNALTA